MNNSVANSQPGDVIASYVQRFRSTMGDIDRTQASLQAKYNKGIIGPQDLVSAQSVNNALASGKLTVSEAALIKGIMFDGPSSSRNSSNRGKAVHESPCGCSIAGCNTQQWRSVLFDGKPCAEVTIVSSEGISNQFGAPEGPILYGSNQHDGPSLEDPGTAITSTGPFTLGLDLVETLPQGGKATWLGLHLIISQAEQLSTYVDYDVEVAGYQLTNLIDWFGYVESLALPSVPTPPTRDYQEVFSFGGKGTIEVLILPGYTSDPSLRRIYSPWVSANMTNPATLSNVYTLASLPTVTVGNYNSTRDTIKARIIAPGTPLAEYFGLR